MVTKVNGTALAAHLGCTRETVNDYVKRRIIKKLSDGKYDQDDCRLKVLAHLRGLSAGRAGSGDKSLSEARAALAKEQTEAVALKNAVARGEYVSLAGVQRAIEGQYTSIRENILAVPGKKAAQLEMRSRGEIEEMLRDELYELLETLSDPTKTLPPEYRAAWLADPENAAKQAADVGIKDNAKLERVHRDDADDAE